MALSEKVNEEIGLVSEPISDRFGSTYIPLVNQVIGRAMRFSQHQTQRPITVQEPVPQILVHPIPNSNNVIVTYAETGVLFGTFSSRDIDMVQAQAECSIEEAIRVLARNEGDIVNAILELTM